jgi:uncharacterized protein
MKPSTALANNYDAVQRIVASRRVLNPRIFGSVASGLDTEQSDLDLLVDSTPETTMLDIGAIKNALQKLLGVRVDVLTPNALPDAFRQQVIANAMPL